MSTSLDSRPTPVRDYFTAMNALDSTGMVTPFAADSLVNDIQREFWGPEAIKRWADRESIGDKVVWKAFSGAKAYYGDYIVSAEVDGEYDKTGLPDPLVLTFYFSLENDKITRLIILGNKPGPLGLSDRARAVAAAITSDEPGSYEALADVIRAALRDPGLTGWMVWPVTEAVAVASTRSPAITLRGS